ncbi:WD40 repeat domain-containing protein [Kosmotoga olearia]|nr:WD40 repeat domain-containing protein [Kosmotoga olearia]
MKPTIALILSFLCLFSGTVLMLKTIGFPVENNPLTLLVLIGGVFFIYLVSLIFRGLRTLKEKKANSTRKNTHNFGLVNKKVTPNADEMPRFISLQGHSGPVSSVAISPDGKYIVSGSWDNTIKLWNINGECLRTFEGHTDWVRTVAISPDGKYIVSGSENGKIRIWNLKGNCLRILSGHSGSVLSLAVSPDGKYIVSGSWDNAIKLWNTNGECLRTFEGHIDWVRSVAISPDGKYIVSGSEDGKIRLWDLKGNCFGILSDHSGPVMSVAISPNGKYIVSGSWDNTIKLWNVNGECLKTFKGHTDWVRSVTISPDGRYIVSGSENGKVRIWDTEGNCLKILNGHSGPILSVAISPDKRYIVTGSRDKTLKLWSLGNYLEIKKPFLVSEEPQPENRILNYENKSENQNLEIEKEEQYFEENDSPIQSDDKILLYFMNQIQELTELQKAELRKVLVLEPKKEYSISEAGVNQLVLFQLLPRISYNRIPLIELIEKNGLMIIWGNQYSDELCEKLKSTIIGGM